MGVMEPTTNDKVNLINRGGWLVAMVTAAILVGVTVAAPIDEKKVVSGSSSQEGSHPGYVLNIIADLGSILKQRQISGCPTYARLTASELCRRSRKEEEISFRKEE